LRLAKLFPTTSSAAESAVSPLSAMENDDI
jgi:hypothetical protein